MAYQKRPQPAFRRITANWPANCWKGGVNVIFEGVANRLAASAPKCASDRPAAERLDRAVAFLNDHGYVASWEVAPDGYLLHTCNCPYEALAKNNPELCGMDLSLASNLLGTTVERVSRVLDGAASCSYRLAAEPQRPAEAAGVISELIRAQSS